MLKVYQFEKHTGQVVAYAEDDSYMLIAANNLMEAKKVADDLDKNSVEKHCFTERIKNLYYKGKKAKIIRSY